MITATPEDVIAEARRMLRESQAPAARALAIADEYLREGDWLHLIVTPQVKGISAVDLVDAVESIETELRKKFGDQILIVPATP